MTKFKEFYNEGRNKWSIFEIRRGEKKWTFFNTETGTWNVININKNKPIASIQKFLMDICATPGELPKTKGDIDYFQFAHDVVNNNKPKIYVKSGMFEKIKKTWVLE